MSVSVSVHAAVAGWRPSRGSETRVGGEVLKTRVGGEVLKTRVGGERGPRDARARIRGNDAAGVRTYARELELESFVESSVRRRAHRARGGSPRPLREPRGAEPVVERAKRFADDGGAKRRPRRRGARKSRHHTRGRRRHVDADGCRRGCRRDGHPRGEGTCSTQTRADRTRPTRGERDERPRRESESNASPLRADRIHGGGDVHGSRDISGFASAFTRVGSNPGGVGVVPEKVREASGGVVRRRVEERLAASGCRVGCAEGEEEGVLRVAPREVNVGARSGRGFSGRGCSGRGRGGGGSGMERLGDGEVRSDGMARHGDVESGVRLEAEEGKDSLVREAEEGGDPSRDARADGAAVAAGRPGEAVGIHDAVGTRGRGAPEPIVGRRAEERRGRLRDVQERRAGDATEEMDELFVRKILHRKIRRPRARRDPGASRRAPKCRRGTRR